MAVLTRPTESSTRSDLELIQGVWSTVAGPKEARLLVAGNRYTFEFVGGDLYMGTFKLNPGQMDMLIEEGPREHVGRNSLCIYHSKVACFAGAPAGRVRRAGPSRSPMYMIHAICHWFFSASDAPVAVSQVPKGLAVEKALEFVYCFRGHSLNRAWLTCDSAAQQRRFRLG